MTGGCRLYWWHAAAVAPPPHLPPDLVGLMAVQGGVFTAAQARAFRHTESQLQGLRRRNVLISVRRGVYAWRDQYVNSDLVERHRFECAAVALTLTAPAVLSHESA